MKYVFKWSIYDDSQLKKLPFGSIKPWFIQKYFSVLMGKRQLKYTTAQHILEILCMWYVLFLNPNKYVYVKRIGRLFYYNGT